MKEPTDMPEFLARIDKACARMNDGLSAFASILAVLVLCMGIIRATEYANALSANSPSLYSNFAGQSVLGVSPYN